MVFENLDGVTIKADRSVIPQGCLSFSEQALYVAEATENEFNKLFESVGINELAVFESTGSEIVYEGEKLDEFKKNAVEFFKNLWAKIKAAYEMVVDKFNEAVKGTKKNLSKIESKQLNYLDPDKKFGKTHHFDFGGSTSRENAHKLLMEIFSDFENGDKDVNQLKQDYEDKIVSTISGTDKNSIKEAKDALKKKYIGEEFEVDLKWVKKNFDSIKMWTFESPTKKIKESFNEEKAVIDDVIAQVKKMKSNHIDTAQTTISLMKDITTTMHQCMSVTMDVLKRRHSEYRNIFTKVYIATQKAAKSSSSSVGESAVIESTQQDLVDKCFNW